MGREREVALAAGFGLAAAVAAVLILREFVGWIPSPADPGVVAALPVALAATCALLALCYEAFRRLVPGHDVRRYARAFLGANLAVDWLFLLTAFRGARWIPGAEPARLQAIASFLPLAYLAMALVPIGCERLHQKEGP